MTIPRNILPFNYEPREAEPPKKDKSIFFKGKNMFASKIILGHNTHL